MTAQSAVVDFERNAVFLRLIDCFEVVCIFKALKSEKKCNSKKWYYALALKAKIKGGFLN